MAMASKRLYREKWESIIFFALGAVFLFNSSCVTLDVTQKKPETVVSEKKPSRKMVFKSEDYVLCRLEGGETSHVLAEEYLGDAAKSWVIEDANEGIPFEKDQMIIIPLKEENKGGLTADGYRIVPVLCYHRFAKTCKSAFCVPTSIFDRQMKYLKDNHYRVISLNELLDFLNYLHAIPKRSVLISIDDGYKSAYDIAYPILKKYGFTATLFIYTDFVDVGGAAITWDQLREMKDDGFEVGSHTLSHCDLTKKNKEENDQDYMARIKKELLVSKQIIDKKLNQNTMYIAYPYSKCNHKVMNICNQVGYEIALTVKRGGNPFFSEPLTLKRDQILTRDMKTFIKRIKTFQELSLE